MVARTPAGTSGTKCTFRSGVIGVARTSHAASTGGRPSAVCTRTPVAECSTAVTGACSRTRRLSVLCALRMLWVDAGAQRVGRVVEAQHVTQHLAATAAEERGQSRTPALVVDGRVVRLERSAVLGPQAEPAGHGQQRVMALIDGLAACLGVQAGS